MSSKGPQTETDQTDLALQAVEDFKKEELARHQKKTFQGRKKDKKIKNRIVFQWLVLIACLCIIAYQIPVFFSINSSGEKPLRNGAYDTDDLTDQCIKNLWQISRLIQEGEMPNTSLVCPASNKPYDVIRTDGDIIVRSPNPELYGFKDIQVSKKKPIPELIK
jgi:hypothetical protein